MPDTTYRLIDTDGSEIGMITDPRPYIPEDDVVRFEGAALTSSTSTTTKMDAKAASEPHSSSTQPRVPQAAPPPLLAAAELHRRELRLSTPVRWVLHLDPARFPGRYSDRARLRDDSL